MSDSKHFSFNTLSVFLFNSLFFVILHTLACKKTQNRYKIKTVDVHTLNNTIELFN